MVQHLKSRSAASGESFPSFRMRVICLGALKANLNLSSVFADQLFTVSAPGDGVEGAVDLHGAQAPDKSKHARSSSLFNSFCKTSPSSSSS